MAPAILVWYAWLLILFPLPGDSLPDAVFAVPGLTAALRQLGVEQDWIDEEECLEEPSEESAYEGGYALRPASPRTLLNYLRNAREVCLECPPSYWAMGFPNSDNLSQQLCTNYTFVLYCDLESDLYVSQPAAQEFWHYAKAQALELRRVLSDADNAGLWWRTRSCRRESLRLLLLDLGEQDFRQGKLPAPTSYWLFVPERN